MDKAAGSEGGRRVGSDVRGFKSPREQNYFFFSVFKLKRVLHVVFLETEGKIAF